MHWLSRFALIVKRLRCDVGPILPRDRPSIDEEFSEISFILKGFVHSAFEPFRKIGDALFAVIKCDTYLVIRKILSVDYNWHILHSSSYLVEWFDSFDFTESLSDIPITPEFVGM